MAAVQPLSTKADLIDEGETRRNNTRMSLPVIIGILTVGIIVLAAIAMSILNQDRRKSGGGGGKVRDRTTILKQTNKRLAQNPKDVGALSELADLYYREEDWEKAFKTYDALLQLAPSNDQVDEFEVTLRHALSAMREGHLNEAYKGLLLARQTKPDLFEISYNLGYLEFRRRNYEKAVSLLREASSQQPEHGGTLRYLGQALFRMKEYKNALATLRRAVDQEPGDKESQFALAQCYYELGQQEQALRIFSHLRADPTLGPSASLRAGLIRLQQKKYEEAIRDFEIGLRHESLKPEVELELRYRMANAYTRNQQVEKAAQVLREIHAIKPDYKDVATQLGRAEELSSDRNLQTYLIGPSSDFVSVCRRIVAVYFSNAQVKLEDIHVESNQHADLLAEVETRNWQDLILFRFIRHSGNIGELMLRDFHTRIKEVKAGRGICFCAGEFTDGARAFVEARLVDLHDKSELQKYLQKIMTRF